MNLPSKKYHVLYANPLLDFRERNLVQRPEYPVKSFDELKNVDIGSISKKDSVLFMWTDGINLTKALDLIKSWGFTYRRIAFVLYDSNDKKVTPRFCLMSVKGKPASTKINKICNVFDGSAVSEVGIGDIIRSYYKKASMIKLLFRQEDVKGWSQWGSW